MWSKLVLRMFYFSLNKYTTYVDISVPERQIVTLHNFFNKNILFSDVLLKYHCSERKLIGEDKSNFPTDYSKVIFALSAGYQNIFTRASRLKNTYFDLNDRHNFIY